MKKYIFDDKNECINYIKNKVNNFNGTTNEYFKLILISYLNIKLLDSKKLENTLYEKLEELKKHSPLYYIILYNIMYKKDVDNLNFFNNID